MTDNHGVARAKHIAVVLADRANYGRLRPVMIELREHPLVDLQVVCAGTTLLDRFGEAVNIVRKDGFDVAESVFTELEGSVLATMAKSVGLAVVEFANVFQRLAPDFLLLIGDRYEVFAAAIAAVYQNICIVHIQGGEVTGSIDESARHAISKLAHYHFPSTRRSGEFLVAMGERVETVFPFGCPSADVVAEAPKQISKIPLTRVGVGPPIELGLPFLLVLFHPVTTEYHDAERQMEELLAAVRKSGLQTILVWPNIDAGADRVSKAIRRFREHHPGAPLHAYKNFEPEDFITLLHNAACAVGNSSSFVRDAAFIGTPVVLVGSRQDGRERSQAVIRVESDSRSILDAIRRQVQHGRYEPDALYGVPGVSKRIVEKLVTLEPYTQKRLAYLGVVP